jgi:hypothetical protein
MFPRELEKLKTDLLKQAKQVDPADEPARADIAARIEAVDVQLYGAKVPTATRRPAPARAVPKASPQNPLTDAEILDGARYLVSIGKSELLTAAQKQALAKAEGK